MEIKNSASNDINEIFRLYKIATDFQKTRFSVHWPEFEKILVETDCPYLTPPSFEGKRNEPFYVKYIAQRIAEIKNITLEEVAKVTCKNTRELFRI